MLGVSDTASSKVNTSLFLFSELPHPVWCIVIVTIAQPHLQPTLNNKKKHRRIYTSKINKSAQYYALTVCYLRMSLSVEVFPVLVSHASPGSPASLLFCSLCLIEPTAQTFLQEPSKVPQWRKAWIKANWYNHNVGKNHPWIMPILCRTGKQIILIIM